MSVGLPTNSPPALAGGVTFGYPVERSHRHHEREDCGDGSASRCAWSRHASRSLRMSSSTAFNSDSRSSAWAARCCAVARAAASAT
jgi:hypothetical protein